LRIPLISQRIILVVVFVKIQRSGFGRNTLAGRITELTALVIGGYHTMLGAYHLIRVQRSAVGAILTGTGNSLTKQYGEQLPSGWMDSLYTSF